jgi:hypothetical protein
MKGNSLWTGRDSNQETPTQVTTVIAEPTFLDFALFNGKISETGNVLLSEIAYKLMSGTAYLPRRCSVMYQKKGFFNRTGVKISDSHHCPLNTLRNFDNVRNVGRDMQWQDTVFL